MSRMCVCGLAVMAACWRGGTAETPVHRPEPSASVAAPASPRPAEGLTADLVLDRISETYSRQLRRCYENYLKRNGSTQGKVMLTFTVDPTGHVINARADGMAPEITTCIVRQMSAWYFAPPRSHDEATFRIPLQLVAN